MMYTGGGEFEEVDVVVIVVDSDVVEGLPPTGTSRSAERKAVTY